MEIYFLRHANAGQHTANPKRDEKRPIDETGEQQCHDVGRALAALRVDLDVVVSSPLTRALQTAQIVLDEIGYKDKPVIDDAMRPESGFEQFQQLLSNYADKKCMMVVGHNPSITDFLIRTLVKKPGSEFVDFKKGAVAKVEIVGDRGTLKWLLTPKMARSFAGGKRKASNTAEQT